jgi:hypothetical protein
MTSPLPTMNLGAPLPHPSPGATELASWHGTDDTGAVRIREPCEQLREHQLLAQHDHVRRVKIPLSDTLTPRSPYVLSVGTPRLRWVSQGACGLPQPAAALTRGQQRFLRRRMTRRLARA